MNSPPTPPARSILRRVQDVPLGLDGDVINPALFSVADGTAGLGEGDCDQSVMDTSDGMTEAIKAYDRSIGGTLLFLAYADWPEAVRRLAAADAALAASPTDLVVQPAVVAPVTPITPVTPVVPVTPIEATPGPTLSPVTDLLLALDAACQRLSTVARALAAAGTKQL